MLSSIYSEFAQQLASWEVNYVAPTLKLLQLFVGLLTLLGDNFKHYPKQANIQDGDAFDFIIVGGGTAGCVLANRLTENSNVTVLVVEYGGLPPIYSDVPGFLPLLYQSPEDWHFHSTNDEYSSQAQKNKQVVLPAGRMLGGSSGASFMNHVRGVKADYDRWESLGNEGWGWQSVLSYFKKIENIDDVDILGSCSASLHGTDGPVKVKKPKWPTTTKYAAAFSQNGQKQLVDINGYSPVGYFPPQFTIDEHARMSAAYTYIKPIKDRRNLFIMLYSEVRRLVVDEFRVASAVDIYVTSGCIIRVKAKREIILSAGALNSPKLLMLSGIGPRKHLEEHNIKVVLDCPNVGENLIDTPLVLVSLTGKPDARTAVQNIDVLTNLNKFPTGALIGKIALNKSQNFPDYQTDNLALPAASIVPVLYCTWFFDLDDNICKSLVAAGAYTETLLVVHSLLHEKSRGSVKLQSNDPKAAPIIRTGFYSNSKDLDNHTKYLIDFLSVLNTDYFKSVNGSVVNMDVKQCTQFKFNTFDYWKCFIRNTVASMYNYAGTCSMGPQGVVDARLRIRDLKNIRVVDASVIPTTISGNIHAAVLMIAEKAADIIKEDNKLYDNVFYFF